MRRRTEVLWGGIVSAALGFIIFGHFHRRTGTSFAGIQPIKRDSALSQQIVAKETLRPSHLSAESISNTVPGAESASISKAEHDEALDLYAMISGSGLHLSEQESRLLITDLMDYFHVRGQIERALAKTAYSDGVSQIVEIPPYPAEGAALKGSLADRINSDFTPSTAADIQSHLASPLLFQFSGFGAYKQTFTITRSPTDPDNQLHIDWKASAGTSVPNEDLAKLVGSYAGSSGSEGLSRTDLLSGKFEGIADLVNSGLP